MIDVFHYHGYLILALLLIVLLIFKLLIWKSFKKSLDSLTNIQQEMFDKMEEIFMEKKRTNKLLSIIGNVEMPRLEEEENVEAKLYVGNIDYSITEKDLSKIFAKFGKIHKISIPINKYTGRGRGFGFVIFSSVEEAEKAISLNGLKLRGRQIQVSFAK